LVKTTRCSRTQINYVTAEPLAADIKNKLSWKSSFGISSGGLYLLLVDLREQWTQVLQTKIGSHKYFENLFGLSGKLTKSPGAGALAYLNQ